MTRRTLARGLALWILTAALAAQEAPQGGLASIQEPALREWLTYLASDELQGREVYTEGLGLAAAYIADHLAAWGVSPGAADGSYFQTVSVLGVKNDSRSSMTVTVGGRSRTFEDGGAISFPANQGGARTFRADTVRFVGYGLPQGAGQGDAEGDAAGLAGAVAVWLGEAGPQGEHAPRALATRSRRAVDEGALAAIGPPLRGRQRRSAGGAPNDADFTTSQRYDRPVAPVVSADDAFFEFLFSAADVPYARLAALAAKREPLPSFTLKDVSITFTIAPRYTVVSRRLTRNVVGIVHGTDRALKETYVAFGAHYDHVGYETTPPDAGRSGGGAFGCPNQSRPDVRPDDIVNNGADDDGSGTVAVMGIARAFAKGPRPKRSLLFLWHTAEETGLQGSRYNADFPVVPNESVIAHLNLDMVGRNRCDDPAQSDTVYLVGSDRISTELHNVSEEANEALRDPLKLDYELNEPTDPQSLYTRSDHFSYASKGIPVIFYTTGLHRDYHFVTDEVDKIQFGKLTRIARLVYATGERLANLERAPAKDNRGPRAGRNRGGRLSE